MSIKMLIPHTGDSEEMQIDACKAIFATCPSWAIYCESNL